MGSACLLRTEDLCFERDEIKVFDRVNLELNLGDILQIEGSNGSGKTTLLRLLTTAIQPTSGRILYRDRKISDCRYEYCSNIVFIGHQIALKDRLTPVENLNWMSPIGQTQNSIYKVLDSVGLREFATAPSSNLSAGQKRRVALARLLISNAKIWFLDEPFTAIDAQGIGLIKQLIDDHVAKDGAVILSTHQSVGIKNVRRYSLSHENIGVSHC